MQGEPHQELMPNCRQEEDEQACHELVGPNPDGRVVDMPQHPLVHRHVPQPPVLSHSLGVPPGLFTSGCVMATTLGHLKPRKTSHLNSSHLHFLELDEFFWPNKPQRSAFSCCSAWKLTFMALLRARIQTTRAASCQWFASHPRHCMVRHLLCYHQHDNEHLDIQTCTSSNVRCSNDDGLQSVQSVDIGTVGDMLGCRWLPVRKACFVNVAVNMTCQPSYGAEAGMYHGRPATHDVEQHHFNIPKDS